jgi:hypothetical protein
MTQGFKDGTLVTLTHDDRRGTWPGGIGIIVGYTPPHPTRPGSLGPAAEAYQVMWSAGPDKQFHIDDCWINPAYLKEITDGS